VKAALSEHGGLADTGKRARDNVRKAVGAVKASLGRGGREERAFAEHLRTHLSIGLECLYTQPQGRVWDQVQQPLEASPPRSGSLASQKWKPHFHP
jgi:hypothetical protein